MVSLTRYRKERRRGKRLMSTATVLMMVLLAAIGLVSLLAPWVAPYHFDHQDYSKILAPPVWADGGSWSNVLGTDGLGRDVLSRVIYAGRVSLFVGFAGVVVGGSLGVFAGLVAGYHGGKLDAIVMRLADVQLAFPYLLLAISVIAAFGTSLTILVGVLSLRSWVTHARLVRGETLSLKEQDYVKGSRAVGAGHMRLMIRHILPNVVPSVIVLATATLAQLIILEATLSFLGLGVPPPAPSWGGMLSEGRSLLSTAWWLSTVPGIAIMVVVLIVNVLGDRLRDVMDPKAMKR